MQPPNAYGQQPVPAQRQRTYRDPRNDPANWNRGGLSVPSYPGVGQVGTGYGKQQSAQAPARAAQFNQGAMTQLNPSQGRSWSSANEVLGSNVQSQAFPMGQASSGMMTSGGVPGWNGYGQPANYFGAVGGQTQIQPIGSMSQVGQIGNDQIAQEQARRLRLLKQQQMLGGQMGQMGNSIPAYQAESPYAQNVTQPFPVQNQWQQRIPQNFNQGTAYDQFTRRW